MKKNYKGALLIISIIGTGSTYTCAPINGHCFISPKIPWLNQKLLNQRSKEPVRVFIAHMDHPGFHGVRWLSASRLSVKWLGGSPIKHLAGRKVWLASGGSAQSNEQRRTARLTLSHRPVVSPIRSDDRQQDRRIAPRQWETVGLTKRQSPGPNR